MAYDRSEVLASTDLAELADELLGPHRGRGGSATWPCPDRGHGNQTGRTPPVTVFQASSGDQRWRCHACGAGGTAVDLVMTTQGVGFRDAIEHLARRANVAERDGTAQPLLPRPARILRPASFAPGKPSQELERYVGACESHLWAPPGRPMRDWLTKRGLGEEVLRANRVGADPGPRRLSRPRGLPRGGPAVVLPVLGDDGRAAYLQARYLHPPSGRKYDNPAAHLGGPSPRVAEVRLAGPGRDRDVVLVCEGIPDALTAAQHGHRAVAVLGAGLPDDRVAAALADRFPVEQLVVAFDADARGRAGAERLQALLADAGADSRMERLDVPEAYGDLNSWQQAAGGRFAHELGRAVEAASDSPRSARTPSASPDRDGPVERAVGESAAAPSWPRGLADRLEVIYYHHVLVDDPRLAAAAVARVKETARAWPHGEPAAPNRRHPTVARLDERLSDLRYHHVLIGDRDLASSNIREIRQAAGRWTAELGLTASAGHVPDARQPTADSAHRPPSQTGAGAPPLGAPNAVPFHYLPPPAPQPDLGVGL